MSDAVLYLTFDGVLSGLGHSQVLRLVSALARRGRRYELVSLERDADLADVGRVDALRAALAADGVPWTALRYRSGSGPAALARNVASSTAAVRARVARGGIGLIHARGYHGAIVAEAIRSLRGVPYLFDARGYWVDEQLAEGRRFEFPVALWTARRIERRLYAKASGVVTLTELQARDVHDAGWTRATVTAIPTCVDYESFALRDATSVRSLPEDVARVLAGKRVLGLVGSLNKSYLPNEIAALTRMVLDLRRDAHVLVVAEAKGAYAALLAGAGVPAERITYARATHEEMPRWLAAMDWSPLLLTTSFAKRASVPTRLGELFAVGVRPLHHGCNDEVTEWVRVTGTGHVLENVSERALREAAAVVASSELDAPLLARGRERARAHFSLASGVDRYLGVLDGMAVG